MRTILDVLTNIYLLKFCVCSFISVQLPWFCSVLLVEALFSSRINVSGMTHSVHSARHVLGYHDMTCPMLSVVLQFHKVSTFLSFFVSY